MSSLSDVYDRNMSQILQTLLSHGKLARSVIADRNSMTRMTVSNIVQDLRAKNIVHEAEKGFASALGGRKPVYLEINKNAFSMIGLDLRREKISGCLVNITGEIVDQASFTIPINCAQEIIWETFDQIFEKLRSHRQIPVLGIGLGSIGPIDLLLGQIDNSREHINLSGMPIRDMLQERYGLPVLIQSGASAAAMGEYFWSTVSNSEGSNSNGSKSDVDSGRPARSLVFIEIDQGVGMGMISNGALWDTNGMGSDIGHMTIDYHGDLCECGRRGCVNQLASGRALLSSLEDDPSRDDSFQGGICQGDLSHVAMMAYEGDAALQAKIVQMGKLLGHAIIDIDNVLHPQRLIIGSSHAHLNSWYLEGIKQLMHKLESKAPFESDLLDRLELATQGSLAIAYGGATLQLKAFYESPIKIVREIPMLATQ